METAVLIGVLAAAALLVASGLWVGLILTRTITRIKRPALEAKREIPDAASITPRRDSAQP